ncbi:holo-ACP synthase [Mycoplasma sp. Mirounga ES2805-ORL]|uniref:holo-ACP synthase n=1 Tax=Mycoplasma sp. Mirounga ES2805-ORL TaxID=754514 RepID=UPI00197C320E|nr:4'-phosphopantetheinyl transferase superfamily protein [Mycoplasma sp. Mirounga ES2805-ORL]QSF13646.1 4'-phosphopantetheinyl transferase superfamily protein [Mycoplasma sp. Mirounga ES2805-ORL]
MIGIDLTNLKRFKGKGDLFARRILHNEEFITFKKLSTSEDKTMFLAKSWALKEAIFKADNSFSSFQKINIVYLNNKPTFDNFELSLSHEKDMVIAIAIKKEA